MIEMTDYIRVGWGGVVSAACLPACLPAACVRACNAMVLGASLSGADAHGVLSPIPISNSMRRIRSFQLSRNKCGSSYQGDPLHAYLLSCSLWQEYLPPAGDVVRT